MTNNYTEPFSERGFIRSFADFFSRITNTKDKKGFYMKFGKQLQKNEQAVLKKNYNRVIREAEEMHTSLHLQKVRQKEAPEAKNPRNKKDKELQEAEYKEDIYISNAGLILVSPYLPRLFNMLGLLDKLAFKDGAAAERAVHLLQFMATESTFTPEHELVLNKVLCGIKTEISLPYEIEIRKDEKDIIERLIKAMIDNWKAIGSTSIKGFMESFLRREGRLILKDNGWNLMVESKAYDMLLDRIPWSFSTIKHPWMGQLIHVQWR